MEDKAGFGVAEGGQLAQEVGQARRLVQGLEKTRVLKKNQPSVFSLF
jgi:hypothetical protein